MDLLVSTPLSVGLSLAAALSPALAPRATPIQSEQFAQVIFHSRVVIRVEAARPEKVREPFREKKGPHCIPSGDIAGAAILKPGSVDMVMRGGARVRARFVASCPALDYYSGFYIVPNADGQICADRDIVRDRAGGECPIDKFRKLVPAR